jgi:GTPase SAR1 family protein
MLRQTHILYSGKRVFTHTFAMALRDEDLKNVIGALQPQINMPIPGKILHRPISEQQVFHCGYGDFYFLMVADMVDSIKYMEEILEKAIKKFKELFPDIGTLQNSDSKRKHFIDFLYKLQAELHSKIAIIGPTNAGKTTLYEMLTNKKEERSIMNFAKASLLNLYDLQFDVWDFQLKDNFSLLWSKFVSGSDLVIFIFDASKYNLKVLDQFLTLKRKESQLSKFIIIANKIDLIDDETIEKIENELEIENIEKLSLEDSKAKQTILELISKALQLKKKLPNNFDDLRAEAENLYEEKNLGKALAKYKELINISNSYQHFEYLKEFKETAKQIENRIQERAEIRRKIQRKKKFAPPQKIKFTKKIQVKDLPKNHISSKTIEAENHKEHKDNSTQKRRLRPSDVKIDLKFNNKPDLKKEESQPKKPHPEENYESIDDVEDIPQLLHDMIKSRGSQLSLKLCIQYINEMESSLKRELNLEDLKTAANYFIKQEISR